jgi:hypothetical protein
MTGVAEQSIASSLLKVMSKLFVSVFRNNIEATVNIPHAYYGPACGVYV